MRGAARIAAAILSAALAPPAARAAADLPAPAHDTEALAKQLQNPVASLISFPIQSNWDFGFGDDDEGWRYTANVQPVVPISLSGLGVREGMFVLLLHPLGVPNGQAIGIGLLWYLVMLLVSLLGAPAFAVGNRTGPAKVGAGSEP